MINFKTKLLFLPLEIKTRELYPKLFFAVKALNRGFSFFIGDKAGIFRATKYFNNGVYFYKSINFTDTKHIKNIKNKNNKYIVLDEEGGFTFNTIYEFSKFLTVRTSHKNVELIDKFFNWGKFDYKICTNRYLRQKKKFCISGGLRFEVCEKKNVKKIYKNEIEEIKQKYGGEYILITTSHLTSKKEIKNYENSDQFFMKFKNKKAKQIRYKELLSLLKLNKAFKELLFKLFKKFPDKKFIVRPHPSENLNDWKIFIKKSFLNNNNIFIEPNYDLNSLIYLSKCIINSKSASGLQAQAQGKTIISFNPKHITYTKRVTDHAGYEAKNINDVVNILKYFFEGKKNKNIKTQNYKSIDKHVENFSFKTKPSRIILDEINKIYKSYSKINILKIIILSPIYIILDAVFKILKIRYYNPKLYSFGIRDNFQKMGKNGIKKAEITNFLKNLGYLNKVYILKFGKNCFFILNKGKLSKQ